MFPGFLGAHGRYLWVVGGHVFFIELQDIITLYRTCTQCKICYRSESYVRDDRGRRLRDWPAHPTSRLMVYVRFLRITRIFHGRGEGG